MAEIPTLPIAQLFENALRYSSTDGTLLNRDSKLLPAFANGKDIISPINALAIAIGGDIMHARTNNVAFSKRGKAAGGTVLSGEKGIPVLWYKWEEYERRDRSGDRLPASDYWKLPPAERKQWKGVRTRTVSRVYNIDQTTLAVDPGMTEYAALLKTSGGAKDRIADPVAEDRRLHKEFNGYLKAYAQNLSPIRKDAPGRHYYDAKRDVIHLAPQCNYIDYTSWMQDAHRVLATATGTRERLGREGCDNAIGQRLTTEKEDYEALVVELASAYKQLEMGQPARISPDNADRVSHWLEILKEPKSAEKLLRDLERDVNLSCNMLTHAQHDRVLTRSENRLQQLTQGGEKQDKAAGLKFSQVCMVKDEGKWCLYMRPEGEKKGYAVVPEYEDTSLYFTQVKTKTDDVIERTKQKLAAKYWGRPASELPRRDVFLENIDLGAINHAMSVPTLFRAQGSNAPMLVASIDGERQPAVPLTASQWQFLFLAPDKKAYKYALATALYAERLRQPGQTLFSGQEKAEEKKAVADERHDGRYVLDGADLTHSEYDKKEAASKEQETKEAKEREAFRKKYVSPAINAFIAYKSMDFARNNTLILRVDDTYQSYGDDAQRIAKALGVKAETAENGLPFVSFGLADYDDNLRRISAAGIAATVDGISTAQKAGQSEPVVEEEAREIEKEETQTEHRSSGRGR